MTVMCNRCHGQITGLTGLGDLIRLGWLAVLIQEDAKRSRLVAHCPNCKDSV